MARRRQADHADRRLRVAFTVVLLAAAAFLLLPGHDPSSQVGSGRRTAAPEVAPIPAPHLRGAADPGAEPDGDGTGTADAVLSTMEVQGQVLGPTDGTPRVTELRVRVVDEEGRPLKGVSVQARWEEVLAPGSPVTELCAGMEDVGRTDESGRIRARVASHEPGYYLRLLFAASDRSREGRAEVWAPFANDVDVVVRPRLAITGTVTDARGLPVPRASLRLVPLRGGLPPPFLEGESPERLPSTAGDGTFSLLVTDPGPYLLSCEPLDPQATVSEPLWVRAPETGLRLVCPPGRRLRGRIANPAEHGAVIVQWVLRDDRAPSYSFVAKTSTLGSESGEFAFTQALPERAGSLYARWTGGRRCAFMPEVVPGYGEVELHMAPSCSLRGRLMGYDPPSHPPVRVLLRWAGPTLFAEPDERGRFHFGGLPPGRYALGWIRAGLSGAIAGAQSVDPEAGPISIRLSDLLGDEGGANGSWSRSARSSDTSR